MEYCQTEVDKTSAPTSKLTDIARHSFSAAGIDVSDVTELTSEEHGSAVAQFIQSGIDTANRKAISRAQLIQKWTIVPRDFSIAGGELGKCCYISHLSLHGFHLSEPCATNCACNRELPTSFYNMDAVRKTRLSRTCLDFLKYFDLMFFISRNCINKYCL